MLVHVKTFYRLLKFSRKRTYLRAGTQRLKPRNDFLAFTGYVQFYYAPYSCPGPYVSYYVVSAPCFAIGVEGRPRPGKESLQPSVKVSIGGFNKPRRHYYTL